MTLPQPGARVRVTHKGHTYEGILIPSRSDTIVIKLTNGYNVGFSTRDCTVTVIGDAVPLGTFPRAAFTYDPSKPDLLILSTGGTIASRVDYRTGAVIPASTAEEILASLPELHDIANVHAETIMHVFSEDMSCANYSLIAQKIIDHVKSADLSRLAGIIIFHGTDTMHYTASALSFIFKDVGIPILLVGSQRSSDRGSCDGPLNTLAAARFLVSTDFGDVGIAMHHSMNDDAIAIHPGTKVRKLHTSRRDAFKTVNAFPYASVGETISVLSPWRKKKWQNRELLTQSFPLSFDAKVALMKIHPDIDPDLISYYASRRYRGIVLEGTGLGHAPINANPLFLSRMREFIAQGGIIVMTSQCIYGTVHMDVYSTGRDLQSIGVIPAGDMLSEVAYVKLRWLLSNFPLSDVPSLFATNIAGELSERRIE